ncbi:hypothetical protein Ancab_028577 [Ancistrocladus abbreviatus]
MLRNEKALLQNMEKIWVRSYKLRVDAARKKTVLSPPIQSQGKGSANRRTLATLGRKSFKEALIDDLPMCRCKFKSRGGVEI